MKLFLITLSVIYMAYASPSLRTAKDLAALRALPALEHEEIHDEYGQYALRYVTAEGTIVSERGRLVPDSEGKGYVLIIEGEISYIGDDGNLYITRFTAGLDGTSVEGNNMPVPSKPIAPAVPVVPRVPKPVPTPVPMRSHRVPHYK
ncbi:uncharacterized protein LOC133319073 [Danaus plexippus]|uniref:uncharacterized protein LOC133319073 n=1 Tax=Danaus plexippus TaxID=13037 RepID=UPI002AB23C72|nr:uncharacterized protein LOC133319073 [Danaus plexippus]